MWFLNNWKAIAIAAACAVIGFGFGYGLGYFNGKGEGKKTEQAAQNTAVLQKVKSNEKKKQEIRRLDDDSLKRRYCRWVFDKSFDECVRTIKFVD